MIYSKLVLILFFVPFKISYIIFSLQYLCNVTLKIILFDLSALKLCSISHIEFYLQQDVKSCSMCHRQIVQLLTWSCMLCIHHSPIILYYHITILIIVIIICTFTEHYLKANVGAAFSQGQHQVRRVIQKYQVEDQLILYNFYYEYPIK